jgi:hypothetical protein
MMARKGRGSVTLRLNSQGINYGWITANASGQVDYSRVEGVDPDPRVKPFFAQGSTISIRESVVGAMQKEVGIEINDPDLAKASKGGRVMTPSGMVLDGRLDKIRHPPPGEDSGQYEADPAVVHLVFYLLNYFKPGLGKHSTTEHGRAAIPAICLICGSITIAGLLMCKPSTIP